MKAQSVFGRSWSCGRGLAAAFTCPLLVLLAGSCGEDNTTAPGHTYEVGAFEGSVLAGGVGVQAFVGARAATGLHRGYVLFLARTDSTGHYRLAVPSGSYWLEVNPSSGLGVGMIPGLGDTVTVTDHVRHVDLRCASVRFRFHVPPAMEGREVHASLGTPRRGVDAKAVVRDGELDYVFPLLQAERCTFGLGTRPPRFWLRETYDSDSAEVFVLPDDRPFVVEAALNRWATLSGVLEGVCPGYAIVEAVAAADSVTVGSTSTETNRSFVLDVFSARPVKVRAEFDGVERWVGGESFTTAQVFDLQPGDVVSDLSVAGGGILCTLDGPGNTIHQRATVILRDESGRNHGDRSWSHSPVTICNLRPGRYYLYVTGIFANETWGSQWYNGATSVAQATPIDVSAGELTSVTVHLTPGGAIEGRLLHADGTPIDYGRVTITDTDRIHSADHWVQPRELGTFRFQGLGDGGYFLAAATDGGDWWFPGTSDPASAQRVEVIDHATVSGIEWRLP